MLPMCESRFSSSRQPEKFPACFWTIREEVRLGLLLVTEPRTSDGVATDILLHLIRADRVNLRRVESENLGPELRGDFTVAVFGA